VIDLHSILHSNYDAKPPGREKLHANFDEIDAFSQAPKFMLFNELRQTHEQGIDPVAHVVSNLLLTKIVLKRKILLDGALCGKRRLQYKRTQSRQ
jgi:hypothetical protein